jgi:hypothetical protein
MLAVGTCAGFSRAPMSASADRFGVAEDGAPEVGRCIADEAHLTARARGQNIGDRSYALFDSYVLEPIRLPWSRTLDKLENHGGVAQW